MTALPKQLRQALRRWGTRVLQCHGDDCSRPRRMWERMSSRSGSICVHGLPFCFPNCFERELRRRFERLQGERAVEARPRRRVPLGLLMLARADVTGAQVRHALAEHYRDTGVRVGECLQRLGYASEPQVTAALAMQWQCPVLSAMPQQIRDCRLPHGLLTRFQMLPVHFSSPTQTIHLAFAHEIAYRALVAIEQMLDCKTEPCLTTPTEIRAAFERLELHTTAPEKQFAARDPAEMARITSSYAARLEAEDVKLVACGELTWVRIEHESDFMNLLFQRPGCVAALGNSQLALGR